MCTSWRSVSSSVLVAKEMAFVSEIQHANLRYQDDSLDLEQIMMVIEIEDSASSFAQF